MRATALKIFATMLYIAALWLFYLYMTKKTKLTPRQKKFISEYLIDRNGKQAAIRAGFSKKNAKSQASVLLALSHVAEEVNRRIKKQEEKLEIKSTDILREILKIAKSDIRKAFNDDGSLKDVKDLPDDIAAAIGGIDVDELFEGRGNDKERIGYTKKIKLWNKCEALEMLGKHLKLFDVPDNSITNKAIETMGTIVKDAINALDKR